MPIPIMQTALNAGELSPSLFGRVDLEKYRSGCSTLRNMWASYRGGACSRAGTLFCGQSKQAGTALPPVLIPFQFSIDQGYALEFGATYMRVISEGAYVTEAAFNISSASLATTGVFIASSNDFAVDDWVYISGVGGMTQVNGNTYAINTIPTTGSFTLKSTLTGAPLNTTSFSAYTSGGTVARIYTLTTPYAVADVPELKWAQSADVMSITHPSYTPQDLARVTASQWTITATIFTASIGPPSTIAATAATTTSSNATQYQYVVTSVDALTGDESIASAIATITNSVNIASTAGASRITWSQVSGAGYYNVYKAPPAYGAAVPVGALFGYAGTSFGLAFTDVNITQDLSVVPPLHFNPFAPGQIDYFTITATGSGYTSSTLPTVYITDATGSGATGLAVVVNGGISAIIVTDGGINYTAPAVSIGSPSGSPGTGGVVVTSGPTTWNGSVTVSAGGSGYHNPIITATYSHAASGQPSITVSQLASGVTVSSGAITVVTFAAPAYSVNKSAVTITINDGTGSGAAATAHVAPTTGTYPSCVAYFQQRRFYADTLNNPDTYFASQPGAFVNMDRSIPTVDSDAIVGTPWAQQVNGIQAMVPMPGGMVVLTGLGAWQLSGGASGAPVTPTSQTATAQAYNGCHESLKPIVINYDILYVQQMGSIVRDLSYNFFVNIYTGSNITMLSNHLFDGYQIISWDWSEEPNHLVWAIRNDGTALALTFVKDQEVYAWSRHDTNGLYQGVCVVSEPPVNAPYFVVKRLIQNNGSPVWAYYIERMDNRIWANIEDSWCVDCGLSLSQTEPNATITASSATGTQNIRTYTIAAGGTGYTAPTAVVTDADGGSGATLSLTVSGGIITGTTPGSFGSGYVNPVVTITDSTGHGGSITANITNYVTFSASASVFTSANVGDVIRMGGGKATVATYTNGTTVIGNITEDITAIIPDDPNDTVVPQVAGNWTITTPVTTVGGLGHLAGMGVVALADGNVVTGKTVSATGSITLSVAASSIVVGLPYTAQMQTLYLEYSSELTVQGRSKNMYQVNLRVENSRMPDVGANQPDQSSQPNQASPEWSNLTTIVPVNPTTTDSTSTQFYTGDCFADVTAEWNTNGQIAIQMTDPVPVNITGIIPWVEVHDDPG